MQKSVCAVFDSKSGLYANPFYAVNSVVAVRDFITAARDPAVQISKNPEDYSLYQLATFDDESGLFTSNIPPLFLSSAITSKE
jgi:hypothetical protein